VLNQRRKRKSLAKPIITVVLLASVAAVIFWYFYPSSRPAWLADRLPVAASATSTMYRWTNDTGLPVISDQKPPVGVEFEVIEYRNDQNVIPAQSKE